jgi:hypothetical protein
MSVDMSDLAGIMHQESPTSTSAISFSKYNNNTVDSRHTYLGFNVKITAKGLTLL